MPWKGRIDMGDLIDVAGLGKLSIASKKDAKLLLVFGGIPVDEIEFDGVQRKTPIYVSSGVYMWPFMNDIKDKYHIFVSVSNDVNGTRAYDSVISKLKENNVAVPSKQILYLFSGGQAPGVDLLTSKGAETFSLIFLVDIWMGIGKKSGSRSPDFYTQLVNKHADLIYYVHTSGGAANNDARDTLVRKLGPSAILVQGQAGEDGMQTHLRTNAVAVRKIPRNGQTKP
jgi:hypothetical protein